MGWRNTGVWTAALCGILCLLFAVISWRAVVHKSYIIDEAGDAYAAAEFFHDHDFRNHPDLAPLWVDFIALGRPLASASRDSAVGKYQDIRYVDSARKMALVLGVGLAIMIAWWSWNLGGAAAAVTATFLYCFDPNFLGHAALAKNDVGESLCFVAASYSLWQLGRRWTWPRAVASCLIIGAAVTAKFSGILSLALLIPILGIRAILPQPWLIRREPVQSRRLRLAVAAGTCLATLLATYLMIWASYDFRFAAGPNGEELDMAPFLHQLRHEDLRVRLGREPTDKESADWRPPTLARIVFALDRKRLLPQAWATGFIYTEADQTRHRNYFFGQVYMYHRNWLYFPAAIAMKCPLATITAIVAALLALAGNHRVFQRAENQWTLAAFAIPPLVYLAVSMHSYLNIGVRHVFPVYPFVFIAVGLGVARLWEHHAARLPLCALAGVLIVETLSAFPNYIAFFNVACRSDEIKLLSDSNLDWGQDLPLLADWQKGHAKTTVYLDYFGSADPAEYGIRSVDIRKPLARPPAEPSVLAVSATYLQLHHFDRAAFKKLGVQRPDSPLAILGGTIYLFTVR